MTYPDFILVGAQKSASTYLFKWLQNHPEVYMPNGESRFFENPEYNADYIHILNKAMKSSEISYGIRRPDYLASYEIPKRIHTHLPWIKLMVVLRNPVERAISAYCHYVKYGLIPPRKPEKGLRSIFGKGSNQGPNTGAKRNIKEYGLYAKYLDKYFELFGKKQILVLYQHELIDSENITTTFKTIANFLGINGDVPEKPAGTEQASRFPMPVLLTKYLKSKLRNRCDYEFGKSYSIDHNDRNILNRALIKGLGIFENKVLMKFLYQDKVDISYGLKQEIYKYYEQDIAKLETILDKDLSVWKYDRN